MISETGDSSYYKLKSNVKGFFDTIPVIEKALENRASQLPDILREKRKIKNWIGQIKKMNDNIDNIKKSKIAELERNIKYNFREPDLVVLSFVQPSIINVFREIICRFFQSQLKR